MVIFSTPTPKDLPRILELERQLFCDPWPPEALAMTMLGGYEWVVGYKETNPQRIMCYAIISQGLGDQAGIARIGVDLKYQGLGIGRLLMDQCVQVAKSMGFGCLDLRVRVTNKVAMCLYKSYGFEELGISSNYYEDPVEDALMMTLKLGG